jgi:hypothetical protein
MKTQPIRFILAGLLGFANAALAGDGGAMHSPTDASKMASVDGTPMVLGDTFVGMDRGAAEAGSRSPDTDHAPPILPDRRVAATAPRGETDVSEIERRRLFDPTLAELQAEAAGRVYIYEGLRDTDVERALDEEFKRVQNMMFIRVKPTDAAGKTRKDPTTGAAYVQDDGC